MSSIEDYGTDIGLIFDVEGADGQTDGTDLGLADGLDNLYQAIQGRILTPVGSIPLHPTYGSNLSTLIGKTDDPVIRRLVKMMITEALAPEVGVRIALIKNIDVEFDRTTGTIMVRTEIVSIYSSELTVETLIE